MVWQKGKICIDKLGALVVCIVLALDTDINILSLAGVPTKIPWVGVILTGIVISRGANFTHDIVSAINNVYQNLKNTSNTEENKIDKKD